MPIQIRRTAILDNPPVGLVPGQLAVEMANDPPRLWVGVPALVDAAERREVGGTNLLPPALMGAQANLRGIRISPTVYSFSVSNLIVRDADARGLTVEGTTSLCDLNVIGENGRDQAVPFTSVLWIQFYWIYNDMTKVLATIASEALPAGGGPTLPPGFTHSCYIGPIRWTDGPDGLIPVIIRGRRFFYPSSYIRGIIASAVASFTEVTVSTAALVPENADEMVLFITVTGFASWGHFHVRLEPTVTTLLIIAAGLQQYSNGQVVFPNINQRIFCMTDGNAFGWIYVTAYTISNGAI